MDEGWHQLSAFTTDYSGIPEQIIPQALSGHRQPGVRRQNSSFSPSSSHFPALAAPAFHLAITPEGYSRKQSKALTAKSMDELYGTGPCSCTAWAGRTTSTNTGCFLVNYSHCWQRLTRLLKTCHHSCNTD